MLTHNIAVGDIALANYERYHYPHPVVQKRMASIYLTGKGYCPKEVACIVGIHRNSVANHLRLYQQAGLAGLKQVGYQGRVGALTSHRQSLEDYFRSQPARSVNEAVVRIKELTGIERSPERVRVFMRRIGLKPRKLGHIPAKADVAKQADFLNHTLEPLMAKAQAGECHLLFMDAAHFVLSAFIGLVWSFTRLFIASASGRNRINVLGVLHATTLQVHTLINFTYINANCIVEMLQTLAQQYIDKPIYLVLDNARYQHCQWVQQQAQLLGIELIFLPPYSPNRRATPLNLIERLWKFIKKKVCYAQFYDTAAKFHYAIQLALQNVNQHPDYRKQLKSLLSLKFQTFQNAQILTC
jgi:transposase